MPSCRHRAQIVSDTNGICGERVGLGVRKCFGLSYFTWDLHSTVRPFTTPCTQSPRPTDTLLLHFLALRTYMNLLLRTAELSATITLSSALFSTSYKSGTQSQDALNDMYRSGVVVPLVAQITPPYSSAYRRGFLPHQVKEDLNQFA